MKVFVVPSVLTVVLFGCLVLLVPPSLMMAADASLSLPTTDWLINPAPFRATITLDTAKRDLILDNGLVRRTLRLTPNAATIDYRNLVSGEQLVRATGPEARVTIDGTEYVVGGLEGQPVQNYLKAEWIDRLHSDPTAYRFAEWKSGPIKAQMAWQRRSEWLSKDLPWPPPGQEATLTFSPPTKVGEKSKDLPTIEVHYAVYDGIPLIEKWLTIDNTMAKPVRINRTVVETLKVQETESAVEPNVNWEPPSLYIETDYTYCSMSGKAANRFAVRWLPDRAYSTQVSYTLDAPCLLEVAPEFGPEVDLAPGSTLTSIRVFELFRDGTDRERRGLAQRRMYRIIAPWTQENPVMVHLISSDPKRIREIIDQAAEVGVEMVILSFGSGMNLENTDTQYQDKYKFVADYARSKGIALGGYSLLGSRGAATAADDCGGPGSRVRFGQMPCLGSKWGRNYLTQLESFLTHTGFGVLEHDGSYPADTCAHTDHPGHRGLEDSQWVQWTAITSFYKWCRAHGVYLNVPDWYFLNGSNKTGMGYRETNWSLPREQQEIIERQNVFDGTWEKTASMGWMFVPLTQYHGGGAAATIEPLCEHLPHYEARLANLFGAGVQACYRGPRIYDTDATKSLVKKWISFYKAHRQVLDADMIHLRRPDGRDWDGFVHVNPQGKEKALAFFYNPLGEKIVREIRVPLYYAGLVVRTNISVGGGPAETLSLQPNGIATIKIAIPAYGRTWVVFTTADQD